MNIPDNTPIMIGAGQQTWHSTDVTRTPLDALCSAAEAAIADVGHSGLTSAIDTVAMVRFIADATPSIGALLPRNPGRQLSHRLGLADATIFQATIGGNTPQYLVNHFAGTLARGEHSVVLLTGAELLATLFSALRTGEDISDWSGETETEPTTVGQEREGHNALEMAHGLYEPINTYPLFENSLRHHLGTSQEHHAAHIAEVCSRMSRVAASNPCAWKPHFQSAEEIGTVVQNNRYIGYPYTRAMNPVLAVDMAAAVIMTTAGKARQMGLDQSTWIYLRAGTDVNDIWHVSERPNLHTSPAIKAAWESVSARAGIALDEISSFDIYSCFPSAVQVACSEIGLSPLDNRGITVTGGMPFFGGPGNNYSLHAIAQMIVSLRDAGNGHGLVTANGLYLTKHSLGIYSTEPPMSDWQDIDRHAIQERIDATPRMSLAPDPSGPATIETYTVSFGREGPTRGIIIGRNPAGERIVANTGTDADTLSQLIAQDPIGHSGNVRVEDGINLFEM